MQTEIKLTQGRVAIIDTIDYPTLSRVPWAVYKTVQYHVEKRRESDVKEQQEKEAGTSSV